MIDGNLLLVIIYTSGCVVATWIYGNMIEKALYKGKKVESGIVGCYLSWVAIIILLIKYKEHL